MFDKCLEPTKIKIGHGKNKKTMYFPCGQCLLCRQKKAMEWSLRGFHELFETKKGTLITLTYNKKHLPKNPKTKPTSKKDCCGTLDKTHLQKFIKRFRKWIDKKYKRKIRYIACGEYGESEEATKRPHYHILVYGILPQEIEKNLHLCKVISDDRQGKAVDIPILSKIWGMGKTATNVEPVISENAVAYVTGYIKKKSMTRKDRQVYIDNHKLPPFQTQSQGIGRYWCDKYQDMLVETLSIPKDNIERTIPRYYIKRIIKNNGFTIKFKRKRRTDFNTNTIYVTDYYQLPFGEKIPIRGEIEELRYNWNYEIEEETIYKIIPNMNNERTKKLYQTQIKKMENKLKELQEDTKNEYYFENLAYYENKCEILGKFMLKKYEEFEYYTKYGEKEFIKWYYQPQKIDDYIKKKEKPYKEKDLNYTIISENYTNHLKAIANKKVTKIKNGLFGKRNKV